MTIVADVRSSAREENKRIGNPAGCFKYLPKHYDEGEGCRPKGPTYNAPKFKPNGRIKHVG